MWIKADMYGYNACYYGWFLAWLDYNGFDIDMALI